MLEIYGWDEADFRCVPCLKAKRLAESRGFDYNFIPLAKNNITETHARNREELEERLSKIDVELKTLPQVFFDGKLVGGFSDFKETIHATEKRFWEAQV